MEREFDLDWNYSKIFSPIKTRNIKTLLGNLKIKIHSMQTNKTLFRNSVKFELSGTKRQEEELEEYMAIIRKVAN